MKDNAPLVSERGGELFLAWCDVLVGFIRENAVGIFLILLALLVVQSLRLAWNRGIAARRVGRHRRLGAAGEKLAKKLLHQSGFRILAEQSSGSYELLVEGDRFRVQLRADYVVSQKGKTYVAEVKSGEESVKVTGRATRRQLLEYLYAFEVNGVLLVDMREQSIRRVEFPSVRTLSS